MKRKINVWDYAGEIIEKTGNGVLLTTKAGGAVNTMTIGWGTVGIQWRKPVFIAFVRQSRYTKELLDKTGEFTVNVPVGEINKQILGICGSKSGRDMDKIKELGLHLEAGEKISVPGIKELPLTLECKVIYKQDQVLDYLEEESRSHYYAPGSRDENDYHTAYYGKIVDAYIIEE
ncbi:MAG: flavin reductase family protein [Oscillospiraceae bacterium]|nr:flavin reductase family protein [Oscillospiraceae bacterium]